MAGVDETPVARMAPPVVCSPFTVEFADGDGRVHREPLTECGTVSFETVAAVRSFPSYRGQRNWPGLWWSATTDGHIGYESWLERDHAMLLDFDPEVTAFAAQPFWLLFRGEDGAVRRHAPDFFARRRDGTALVLDCRPDERIEPEDAEAFTVTERACALVGWEYRRVGAVEPVLAENVRWLAGYRHSRHHVPGVAAALRQVFAESAPLMAGAEAAGRPIAVLPVLFHLLWTGRLCTVLSRPLSETSLVWSATT